MWNLGIAKHCRGNPLSAESNKGPAVLTTALWAAEMVHGVADWPHAHFGGG